jgi:hypothetical protein
MSKSSIDRHCWYCGGQGYRVVTIGCGLAADEKHEIVCECTYRQDVRDFSFLKRRERLVAEINRARSDVAAELGITEDQVDASVRGDIVETAAVTRYQSAFTCLFELMLEGPSQCP